MKKTYQELMQITRDKLAAVGIEDLNLRGNHILLSVGQFRATGKGLSKHTGNQNMQF